MLKVTVYRDSENLIAALEVEGHTDFAPRGSDVACAGASALVQAALLGCIKILGIKPGIQKDDGYLYFSLPANLEKTKEEKAQVIIETAVLGLEEIKKSFPNHVKITSVPID